MWGRHSICMTGAGTGSLLTASSSTYRKEGKGEGEEEWEGRERYRERASNSTCQGRTSSNKALPIKLSLTAQRDLRGGAGVQPMGDIAH